MVRKSLCLAAFGAAVLATPSLAQTMPPPPPPAATSQAVPFLMTAASSDQYEIQSSRVALQKTRRPEIREFANMLIAHHTKTSADAMAAAKADRVNAPPPRLMPAHQKMVDELKGTSAADFDRVFLAQQLPAHQGALTLMQGYAASGDKPALRQAATGAVPIIQSHIDRINQLQSGR